MIWLIADGTGIFELTIVRIIGEYATCVYCVRYRYLLGITIFSLSPLKGKQISLTNPRPLCPV